MPKLVSETPNKESRGEAEISCNPGPCPEPSNPKAADPRSLKPPQSVSFGTQHGYRVTEFLLSRNRRRVLRLLVRGLGLGVRVFGYRVERRDLARAFVLRLLGLGFELKQNWTGHGSGVAYKLLFCFLSQG